MKLRNVFQYTIIAIINANVVTTNISPVINIATFMRGIPLVLKTPIS
jgi:hypothetical protein